MARSYRIPVELDRWINQTASANGIKPAVLVRDLLELGRVAYQEADRREQQRNRVRSRAVVSLLRSRSGTGSVIPCPWLVRLR